MRYTEARLTAVAARLLEGIDEDAVDFRPTYDGEAQEPVVLPANFPKPAGQRRPGHRRGHGHLDPAAQRRRAGRRAGASGQASPGRHRDAGRQGAGAGLPDRRPAGRAAGVDRRGLPHRPRQLPPARPLGGRAPEGRHLPGGGHGDPLPGGQGQADRADRRAAEPEEAGDAGRHPRRVDRGRAPGAGAAQPQCRARGADGIAVPSDRPRGARPAQPQCAGTASRPRGCCPCARRCNPTSTTAMWCCNGALPTAWTRSPGAWRCWKAIWWPTSTSTR